MSVAPQPAWWLDAFVARMRLLEGEVQLRPRQPGLAFCGPLWRLVDTGARQALAEQLTVLDTCERWYSGAFLLEMVPSAPSTDDALFPRNGSRACSDAPPSTMTAVCLV